MTAADATTVVDSTRAAGVLLVYIGATAFVVVAALALWDTRHSVAYRLRAARRAQRDRHQAWVREQARRDLARVDCSLSPVPRRRPR